MDAGRRGLRGRGDDDDLELAEHGRQRPQRRPRGQPPEQLGHARRRRRRDGPVVAPRPGERRRRAAPAVAEVRQRVVGARHGQLPRLFRDGEAYTRAGPRDGQPLVAAEDLAERQAPRGVVGGPRLGERVAQHRDVQVEQQRPLRQHADAARQHRVAVAQRPPERLPRADAVEGRLARAATAPQHKNKGLARGPRGRRRACSLCDAQARGKAERRDVVREVVVRVLAREGPERARHDDAGLRRVDGLGRRPPVLLRGAREAPHGRGPALRHGALRREARLPRVRRRDRQQLRRVPGLGDADLDDAFY